jgi:hypothetical protein
MKFGSLLLAVSTKFGAITLIVIRGGQHQVPHTLLSMLEHEMVLSLGHVQVFALGVKSEAHHDSINGENLEC